MGAIMILLGGLVLAPVAWSQTVEAGHLDTEHPRIFLRPRRLKLLQRERERQSVRWEQFHSLINGNAPVSEQGFALALHYRVSGDPESGRRAVEWALGAGADLRQLALVFDWCHDLLSASDLQSLSAKIRRDLDKSPQDSSIPEVRSRILAAIAVDDGRAERMVRNWWESRVLPALKAGKPAVPREEVYALFEILHVVRDNLRMDLRESDAGYFKNLPIDHLLSHYPASFDSPEGRFRIPASRGQSTRQPEVQAAALSRAAELSMVAFDPNSLETQILQGWLMYDQFTLHGVFGAVYEFLWANPYQPGLSYYTASTTYRDERFGRLFIRSDWEESARWLGWFDGELQLFERGAVKTLDPARVAAPIEVGDAVICFGTSFRLLLKDHQKAFVMGLQPHRQYTVAVNGKDAAEVRSDSGGVLMIDPPRGVEVAVRLRETSNQKREAGGAGKRRASAFAIASKSSSG